MLNPGDDLDIGKTVKFHHESNTTLAASHHVHAHWDEQAAVWVAVSDDVPGLATEAETSEALIEKLKVMIPELLECNGQAVSMPITFELMTRRFEVAA